MKLRRFCAKCGKPITDANRIPNEFICRECSTSFIETENTSLKITLRRCKECGAFSLLNQGKEFPWIFKPKEQSDMDFLSDLLYKHIFLRLEKKEDAEYSLFFEENVKFLSNQSITVIVESVRKLATLRSPFLIREKDIMCVHCAKKVGGRFDAVVQIRIQHDDDKERLEKIMEEVGKIDFEEKHRNLKNFISVTDTVTNGFDLKTSSNPMSNVLIRRLRVKFHLELKTSKKLMGPDPETGGDMYRHYTLLRLLPVIKNDIVLVENVSYRVKKVTKNKVVLQHLTSNKVQQHSFSLFQKKKWKILSHSVLKNDIVLVENVSYRVKNTRHEIVLQHLTSDREQKYSFSEFQKVKWEIISHEDAEVNEG